MLITLIVAVDEAGCIGVGGGIPWRLRTDLQRFKRLTMGHHLIVGRRTWESIGRGLAGRTLVVVSGSLTVAPPDIRIAATLDEALRIAQEAGETEAFIGGGAVLYAAALPLAQRIHLTRVHARCACDTYMPPYDPAAWVEVERQDHPAGPDDEFAFTDVLLQRRSAA